jgi:endonuclease G
MKLNTIRPVVEATSRRLPPDEVERLKKRVQTSRPPDLVEPARIALREARLEEAETRPSATAKERILGKNDLVDLNYLIRALKAARAVGRVILREPSGREIGYGTGFKVSPGLMLTNEHVLERASAAEQALIEFDYELDEAGLPRQTTRFRLDPGGFFINDTGLDFALAAISPEPLMGQGRLDDYGFLRLQREIGKINPGEFVTIIQHPSGLPKQVAVRENELLSIEERVLWYQSDTAQGSSGSPVFNDSWQIVGLHHSGVPRTNAQGQWLLKNGQPAGPDDDDAQIDWIANEGIRASRIVLFVEANADHANPHIEQFLRASSGELKSEAGLGGAGLFTAGAALAGGQGMKAEPVAGGARLTLPLTFTISIGGLGSAAGTTLQAGGAGREPAAAEAMKIPIIDPDYSNRQGYDPNFLGVEVPLPGVRYKSRVAKMEDGSYAIPYEHFSVVVEKRRRLALFTASNVDASPVKREPEPGDYSRRGLSGLGEHDIEQWLTDPRIPALMQLPDRFYTYDGQAFDKGHIVRRDDVCWGSSYAQVRRANGDTFHTTNCSPQVSDFNRSQLGGVWGKLENVILAQARTEKYCLYAGPRLSSQDRTFLGKDEIGPVRIQIPSAYWKIVIARTPQGALQAFGFLLEQDLTGVPLEFAVAAEWLEYMVSIEDLDLMLTNLTIPQVVKDADQFGEPGGDELLHSEELRGLKRR